MKYLASLLIVVLLGGCNEYYKLVSAERLNIGDAYSIDPQIEWSTFDLSVKVPAGGDDLSEREISRPSKYQAWTVDGASLQTLYLYHAVGEGDALFPGKGLEGHNFPTFRGTMKAPEVVEFLVDSYERLGLAQVKAKDLRPAEFGSLPGFRFELSYLSSDGLEYEGSAIGVVNGGVLNLIVYDGTRHYYYPKYRDQVERLISSIEVL